MTVLVNAEAVEPGHMVLGIVDGETTHWFHGWTSRVKSVDVPIIGHDDEGNEILGAGLVFRGEGWSHRVMPDERVLLGSLQVF